MLQHARNPQQRAQENEPRGHGGDQTKPSSSVLLVDFELAGKNGQQDDVVDS